MSVKYWPCEVGEASLFGSFQLELSEDEKDKGDYVTRKFKLSHVDAVRVTNKGKLVQGHQCTKSLFEH
jgi:hypothetical protein